jgi:BirA family transcriptional regulator, biotin operon repressor / biotin---[acetyl-CoA-carboxylase] ligase
MPEALFSSAAESAAFANVLSTRAIGKTLQYFPRTQSTNDLAMRAAREGAAHGATFIADAQDGGRGRRGRAWQSPPNLSLLLSVVVRPNVEPADFGWVPLCAGAAAARAISASSGMTATIKWPNDIIVPATAAPGWRKLGGVLCESVVQAGASRTDFCAVVGIGLNINQSATDLPPIAKAPPTSAQIECGIAVNRQSVLAALLHELEQQLDELAHAQRRAALKNQIEQQLQQWWSPQRMLRVHIPGTPDEIVGRFAGLDVFGRLKITSPDGKEQTLTDAEIISAMPG